MGFGSSSVCDIRLNSRLNPEDRARFQNTKLIRDLLGRVKTIAIVGLSSERTKASNMVGSYLQDVGYRVVPVHPKADSILGEKCYPSLLEIPHPVDLVDIFRPSAEVPMLAEQALAIHAPAVWLQLRIIDLVSGNQLSAAGISVVMDKCIKMEHGRFGGMLHWAGMNTEIITAQRRKA